MMSRLLMFMLFSPASLVLVMAFRMVLGEA
jgi:hypothetical protein